MTKTTRQDAMDHLKVTVEQIAREAGPELFRTLVDDVTIALGPSIRQELAEGTITEDHPSYQSLLEFERRQAAAANRPPARRKKGKRK